MKWMYSKWFKRTYRTVAVIVVAVALVMGYCEHQINVASESRTYTDVNAIPHNEVGILLGTGPVSVFGGVNPYFTSRIEATTQLWKAGKIDRIIISGHNKGPEYNEPQIMCDSLLAHGVPRDIITLDGDGVNTQASIDNAHNLFHLTKFTLISQQFHNERALYMAANAGEDAIALNAGENYYGGLRFCRMWFRERLSRIKAVAQHSF